MARLNFELVFSFYAHPFFGVVPEPYLVQLLDNGSRSLTFQKVAEANIEDFFPDVRPHDRALLRLLQPLSNNQLAKDLGVQPRQLEAHIQKLTDAKDQKGKQLLEVIRVRASESKAAFFAALDGSELLFEMSKDGYPAGSPIYYKPDVEVRMEYHFEQGEIRFRPWFSNAALLGQPIQLLDETTYFVLAGNHLIRLPIALKPSRMKPFLEKTWVTIQPRFAAEYARKILVPDLEMGIAELNGSYVQETIPLTAADVYFSFEFEGSQLGLFDAQAKGAKDLKLPPLLSCEIRFLYGKWESKTFSENGTWIFHEGEIPKLERIGRDAGEEARLVNQLEQIWNLKFAQNKAKLGFVHLRDAVLNQLDQVPDMVKIRFSPEFNQLVMGKPRLDVRVFEKIDYFKIEGSIDWDGETYDLFKLRSSIRIEEGWLKIGEAYFPLQDGEQLFLSQLLSLSQTQDQEWTLPKTTVRAISENRTGVFAEAWNKVTGLLANLQKPPKVTSESLSPNFLLREYQVKGVQWFLHLATNGLGGILADDMGLGKTFQAAAYLRYMRNLEPDKKGLSLIVMPSTLIFNWQYELKRFSPDFKVYVHSGPQRMPSLKGLQDYFNVVLVSFQTLVRDTRLFSAIEFDNLIVDEAHYLKNPGTAAYKAAKALNAKRTFLLTGTPLQNSPADLWALSELCNPGLLSSKIKPAALQKMDNLVRFQESMKLLQGLVSPFLLRRTKENVLTELPEKSVSVLYCSMTEEQEIEYLAYNQFVSGELSDLSYQNASSRSVRILKALTALRLMANHPALVDDSFGHASGKFDLVCEKLEEVLQEGRKVLIFSSFVRHLNLFAKHLETRGFGFTMLTGKTGNRKEVVDRFKTDTDCNVFLISLKAGGFGLNLVEASYVFLLDPWWNPAAENQAMDRVYRIGQKNKVSVYKFITSNTVEEKILKLQERKSSLNDQLFENDEANPGKFSLDTLKEILIQNL